MFYFAFGLLLSQVAITLRFVVASGCSTHRPNRTPRIYAITGNNRLIAGCLSFMSLVQFGYGMYVLIRYGLRGCESLFPLLE